MRTRRPSQLRRQSPGRANDQGWLEGFGPTSLSAQPSPSVCSTLLPCSWRSSTTHHAGNSRCDGCGPRIAPFWGSLASPPLV